MTHPPNAAPDLLVIVKSVPQVPPQDAITAQVYALLCADRPEWYTSVGPLRTLENLVVMGTRISEGEGSIWENDLESGLMRTARGRAVGDHLPMLRTLVRRLIRSGYIDGIPGVRCIAANDATLSALGCCEKRFRLGVVYRAHPADPDFYLPFASFHDLLLLDKVSELSDLFIALGAKEVRVLEESEESDAASVTAKAAGQGPEFDKKRARRDVLDLRIKVPVPVCAPQWPVRRRWYHQESSWQSMAQARLRNFIGDWRLTLENSDDYGVTGSMGLNLEGLGLSLGGSFRGHRAVGRGYRVTFFSAADYAAAGIAIDHDELLNKAGA